MHKVSPVLLQSDDKDCHAFWCPGCLELHVLDKRWPLQNGNLDKPTFGPGSYKEEGKQITKVNGRWTGGWVLGPDGKALAHCCHFYLENGQFKYQQDCTHELRGRTVDMPNLPDFWEDCD